MRTRIGLPALALLGLATLAAHCRAARSAGVQCASSADCSEGLACVTGFCRAQCMTNRDCPAGGSCVLGPSASTRYCVAPPASAEFRRLCGSNADCQPEQGRVRTCAEPGLCVSQCTDNAGCASFSEGALCGSDGLCRLPANMDAGVCSAGTACGSECVDLQRDPLHCGSCANACPSVDGGVSACVRGACVLGCGDQFHACGSLCVPNNAVSSCGARCAPCVAPANGVASCVSNACDFTCNAGFTRQGSSCVAAMDAGLVDPSRPLWPPSGSVVSTLQPVFRFRVGTMDTAPTGVLVCLDRALTAGCVTATTGDGGSFALSAPLAPGVWFWQLQGTVLGRGARVWHFRARAGHGGPALALPGGLDVNGDGFDDLAVGSSAEAASTGRLYVFHGARTGLTLLPAGTFDGPGAGTAFGASVANAGDVNGDGYSDVVVGAPGATGTAGTTGRALLFLGSSAGLQASGSAQLSTPSDGFFGSAVAGLGDVNGDGYADFAVGALADSVTNGLVGVFYGSAVGPPNAPSVVLRGVAASQLGSSLAGPGDVDGDGYDDLLVGAVGFMRNQGAAFLYRGGSRGLVTTAARTYLGVSAGDNFGFAVAGIGDNNGDGFADFAVGAPTVRSSLGAAYQFYGAAAPPTSAVVTLPQVTGSGTRFGSSFAGGDYNGDGFDDFVVGAYSGLSAAHLFMGRSVAPGTMPDAVLTGPAGAPSFTLGLGSGDYNGDGFAELAASSPSSAAGGSVFVYYGASPGLPASPNSTLTSPVGPGSGFGGALARRLPPRRTLLPGAWLSASR